MAKNKKHHKDTKNRENNLSHEDRVKGGEKSASVQERDKHGQFNGKKWRHKLAEKFS